MIGEFLEQAVMTLIVTILFTPLIWWMQNKLQEVHSKAASTRRAELPGLMPNAVASFLLAFAAAAVWGLANAVTRYSAEPFRPAVFEIAIIQFLGGALSILLVAISPIPRVSFDWKQTVTKSLNKYHVLSSIAMAINTYAFALGVSYISAGSIATLENMQVVWIAFMLTFVLGIKVPVRWAFSSLIVLIGAVFITDIPEIVSTENDAEDITGYVLGIVAGLSFAVYTLLWSRARSQNTDFSFKARSCELAVMFGLCMLLLIPTHLAYLALSGSASIAPSFSLPFSHLLIQFGIGVTSLGLTYVLMNEALQLLSDEGDIRALLVGLGISFAVFFTLVFEFFIFQQPVTFQQWAGVILFSLGFVMVWRDVNDRV